MDTLMTSLGMLRVHAVPYLPVIILAFIYNCGQVAVNLVNILGPDSILESNIKGKAKLCVVIQLPLNA